MLKRGDVFHSGQVCPESGVYRLKNCPHVSKEQAEIPLVKDHRFPPCKNCNCKVEWEFVRQA